MSKSLLPMLFSRRFMVSGLTKILVWELFQIYTKISKIVLRIPISTHLVHFTCKVSLSYVTVVHFSKQRIQLWYFVVN